MNKITGAIVIFLILLAAAGAWEIVYCDTLRLKPNEIVSALIAVIASLGALVSATFVVASYLQTNKAYIESQRPHLLIFIENLMHNDRSHPVSRINYKNITNNRFNDLTITISVDAENRTYDLSYLFRSKMTMIGQDQRQRSFNPIEELERQGLNLQQTAYSGKEVKLRVGYRYTFNDVEDVVNAQEYRWGAGDQQWHIC